jgi:hypothetical protein
MAIIGINGYSGSGKDEVGKIIQNLTSPEIVDYATFEYGEWIPMKGVSKWQIKKFAGKLKQVCSILTGIPIEKFEDQEFKKTYLGPEWDYWTVSMLHEGNLITQEGRFLSKEQAEDYVGFMVETYGTFELEFVVGMKQMTVRQLLQETSTDSLRDRLHPNVWVNALMADYVRPSHKEARYYDEINKRGLAGYEEVWGEYPDWIITDTRFLNEAKVIKDRKGIIIRVNRPGVKPINNHKSETELNDYDFDYVIDNDSDLKSLESKVYDILTDIESQNKIY